MDGPGQFLLGNQLAGHQGALNLSPNDTLTQALLILHGTHTLQLHHAVVGLLVEATITLEGRVGQDGPLEFQTRGAQAHVQGSL